MSEILTKPDWIPWYIQKMKGSAAYKTLTDYQFGWYSKLLIELADSDLPGYLPNDIRILWKLAGAKTERFFRSDGGLELLARHFNRTDDGLWIYNRRMLEVLHEQGKKLTKRRSKSLSSLSLCLQGLPDWIPTAEFKHFMEMREKIKAPLTEHALKLAMNTLENLRAAGHDPKAVLNRSTFNDWKGLFPIPVEENGASASRPSRHAQTQGLGIQTEPSPPLVWNYPRKNEQMAESVWTEVKSKLQKTVNQHSFETWLKPTKGGAIEKDVLYVRVPVEEFSHVWEKYGEAITEHLPAAIATVKFIAPVPARAAATAG